MDLKKLQKKFKITASELETEMAGQAEDVLSMFAKEIDEPGAVERINNLKDLTLRNLKVMGFLTEDNKHQLLAVIYKCVVDRYWLERDLPEDERHIFTHSYTDAGLKEHQKKYLNELKDLGDFHNKHLIDLTGQYKKYKKVIKQWWKQRKQEDADVQQLNNSKLNGKGKHGQN
jgi:hypothetical protein